MGVRFRGVTTGRGARFGGLVATCGTRFRRAVLYPLSYGGGLS